MNNPFHHIIRRLATGDFDDEAGVDIELPKCPNGFAWCLRKFRAVAWTVSQRTLLVAALVDCDKDQILGFSDLAGLESKARSILGVSNINYLNGSGHNSDSESYEDYMVMIKNQHPRVIGFAEGTSEILFELVFKQVPITQIQELKKNVLRKN